MKQLQKKLIKVNKYRSIFTKNIIFIFAIFFAINLAVFFTRFTGQSSNILQSPAFFTHPPTPVVKSQVAPMLSTVNYLLLDSTTNTILLGNKINDRIFPASTTKLATALTALNLYPLDEVITTVPYAEGKVMELQDGEKVTARTLVSAILVYSANDAAFNLANHYQDGVSGFVREMNNLVSKYGLKSTHFTNFDGIHNSDHYSTVYDLSQLGRLALTLPFITQTVKLKTIDLTDLSGETKYHLTSTNELLGIVPEIEGLKTGWTPEAGGCFIGVINLNGHQLVSVVAQSVDRFADTKALITWAKENVTWNYRSY